MNNFTIKDLALQSVIASIYVILVLLFPFISFSANIQARIAEALLIVVLFSRKNAIGIVIGTFISNLSSPYGIYDAIFGSMASLLVCLILIYTKRYWYLVILIIPPLINGLVVAGIDAFITNTFSNLIIFGTYVFIGEFLVMIVLAIPLKILLEKVDILKETLSN